MGRGGKSRNQRRGTGATSNRRLFVASDSHLFDFQTGRKLNSFELDDLRPLEDRRTWDPEGFFRPARTFTGRPARVTPNVNKNRRFGPDPFSRLRRFPGMVKDALGFNIPRDVVICARRQIRKQVLHAFRKTGKGKGRKPPKFNYWSKVRCK